jgi:uncharacterized membrane protein YphA (DoxX/SURF4 family)
MTFAELAGTGFVTMLALVLASAGISKTRQPRPARRTLAQLGVPGPGRAVRLVAAIELGIAVCALTVSGRTSDAILAGCFALLAVAAAVLARQGQQLACGCFGEDHGRAPERTHVLLNAAGALGAATAALESPQSLAALARAEPAKALGAFAVAFLGAVIWRHVFIGADAPGEAPVSERLVRTSAMLLEERISRRSALVRIAVAGSALCVAPLRYLLYPGSALAVIVPESCNTGECTDGYTAFCCEINNNLNECPTGTFPGGWWMCTDYQGRQLCAGQGVRYYVDCNALPGHPFPGGCRCANNSCEHRRIACNVFRYGQCNTDVGGVTAVVCRMVTCQSPGSIPELNCSSSVSVDNAVCAHEAPCLTPALELSGAGGV